MTVLLQVATVIQLSHGQATTLVRNPAREPVTVTMRLWVLLLMLLLVARVCAGQVAPVVDVRNGRAETIVRNTERAGRMSVTIELLGPLPDLASVRALVSPASFTLGAGETQTVKLRLHEPVAPGTVLRLRTCLTPVAPALASVTGAVARITLRTCIVAKAIVR